MLPQVLRKSRFGVALAIGSIVMALIAMARRRRWRRALSRSITFHHARSGAREVASRRKLRRLLDSIVGNSRSGVLEIFGPPPAVAGSSGAHSIWYYPLDVAQRRAIAIDFDGDYARDAQFVDAPGR